MSMMTCKDAHGQSAQGTSSSFVSFSAQGSSHKMVFEAIVFGLIAGHDHFMGLIAAVLEMNRTFNSSMSHLQGQPSGFLIFI